GPRARFDPRPTPGLRRGHGDSGADRPRAASRRSDRRDLRQGALFLRADHGGRGPARPRMERAGAQDRPGSGDCPGRRKARARGRRRRLAPEVRVLLKSFRTMLHQIRVRPRLATSAAVLAAALLFLPGSLSGPTRALVAWDAGTGLYLVLAWAMMLRASVDSEKMRWRSRLQDDGAAVVLGLSVAAAVASLAAIVLELVGVK